MPATAPKPISLTDDQLSTVMKAAAPLDPRRRGAFLIALAALLRSEPQPVGDGSLGRRIRQLQHQFPASMGGAAKGQGCRQAVVVSECLSPTRSALVSSRSTLSSKGR